MTALNTLYGLVHKGAGVKFADLPQDEREPAYRDWLAQRTGQRSCKGLTEMQLAALVRELKRAGCLPDYRPGGRAPDRPTDAQWRKLAALCKVLSWQGGLDDPALDQFCQRTAHISKARFLNQRLASQVITGLERWIAGGAQ
ncbi:hypothetical protein D3C85_729340 [compost metagenome]